jgi:2-polyprenyl-3-methyl-5-hydroxy-6-metoxy-1,4-benzoquinol methylase
LAFEGDLKSLLFGRSGQLAKNKKWNQALSDRARTIYGQIRPHMEGSSLLDIGCGDGRISSLARGSHSAFKQIHLVDVVDIVQEELKTASKLEFTPYEEGRPLPTGDKSFDTVLLLTVLHHASDPVGLLNLAWRAATRKLIIIESVVGIETEELSNEDQIAFAAFVDWFYNRVLHDDIPVPFNFTTVEKWHSTFKDYNMRLVETKHLGRDIEIGPEYHILFVLEKGGATAANAAMGLVAAGPLSGGRNFWGHEIPTPQYVMLTDNGEHPLRTYVTQYLSKVLALWGLNDKAITTFQKCAVRQARKHQHDTSLAFEQKLKVLLTGQPRQLDAKDRALSLRAQIVYGEIMPHLAGSSLLDIGCGDGRISSLVARSHSAFKRIQLVDVVNYVPAELELDFAHYVEGRSLPTGDESFDTVLLLTVLHHASDPVGLLKLAWQAARRKLIIIESVVGIGTEELSNEDQIAFAAFVDWFYNRVLHDGVPVPCNFTTVEGWQSTFAKCNMPLVATNLLGRDIDIGPEYHVLFALEKGSPAATTV